MPSVSIRPNVPASEATPSQLPRAPNQQFYDTSPAFGKVNQKLNDPPVSKDELATAEKRLWHMVPKGAVEISVNARRVPKTGRFARSLFAGHGLKSPHRINAQRHSPMGSTSPISA